MRMAGLNGKGQEGGIAPGVRGRIKVSALAKT